MTQEQLNRLKAWFDEYCRSFYSKGPEDQKNILLKEEHTRRVCANILRIAGDVPLDGGDLLLAEAIALFHDVGRFPQYRKYKTFKDSVSVNHAALGAKVLIENNTLGDLNGRERDVIIRSVTLHNVFQIPDAINGETLIFLKLIRDADKLDIWRVFLEYLDMDRSERPSAAGLGLPDTADYSPEILAHLKKGEMFNMSRLRTMNDFTLLQLAWIYDLNFTKSFRIAVERGCIEGLAATLPATGEIGEAVGAVKEFARRRAYE